MPSVGEIIDVGGRKVVSQIDNGMKLEDKIEADPQYAAHKLKINKIEDKIKLTDGKLEKLLELKRLLTELKLETDSLRNIKTYSSKEVENVFSARETYLNINNTDKEANLFLGAKALADSPVGTYKINVKSVATPQSLTSPIFSSISEDATKEDSSLFNHGTFYINGIEIEIKEGSNLINIVSSINSKTEQTNVFAIINKITTNQFKLSITSEKPGINNSFSIADGNNIIKNIEKWEKIEAKDAEIIFNGNNIIRSSNEISDVLPEEKLIISLYQPMPKEAEITITTSYNSNKIKKAIIEFIAKYNHTMYFISEQKERDDKGAYKDEATIADENVFRLIDLQLKSIYQHKVNYNGRAIGLTDLGIIQTDWDGKKGTELEKPFKNALQFNKGEFSSPELDQALIKEPEKIKRIFGLTSLIDDSRMILTTSSSAVPAHSPIILIDIDLSRDMIPVNYSLPTGEHNKIQDIVRIYVDNKLYRPIMEKKEYEIKITLYESNSPYEGFIFRYPIMNAGKKKINVTISQGVAEKLSQLINNFIGESKQITKTYNDVIIEEIKNIKDRPGTKKYNDKTKEIRNKYSGILNKQKINKEGNPELKFTDIKGMLTQTILDQAKNQNDKKNNVEDLKEKQERVKNKLTDKFASLEKKKSQAEGLRKSLEDQARAMYSNK